VLQQIKTQLEVFGSTLLVRYGRPEMVFREISNEFDIDTVFCNHDYEPYAVSRDREIKELLQEKGARFRTYKDQVIFEKNEVAKNEGSPYAIYTPYSKNWKALLDDEMLKPFDTKRFWKNFFAHSPIALPSLQAIGFKKTSHPLPEQVDRQTIEHYHATRDLPSIKGTTRLGIHLRFGTVSIRELVAVAKKTNEIYLNELIWREFFMHLLWHQPRLVYECCKKEYENIQWRNHEKEFERWCRGETGYPIVDAGMRELNATGFMHNRVRMITASFLVKHLLIDWRWGEAYFAKKLLDYELASNNGNWQWVAGCGCDAAPYFRIFNPQTQTKKFDPQLVYVKKWVTLDRLSYPKPIVDHDHARERCLKAYKKALAGRIRRTRRQ
jgi:deoxyribodipyrimidine photo-lyase